MNPEIRKQVEDLASTVHEGNAAYMTGAVGYMKVSKSGSHVWIEGDEKVQRFINTGISILRKDALDLAALLIEAAK